MSFKKEAKIIKKTEITYRSLDSLLQYKNGQLVFKSTNTFSNNIESNNNNIEKGKSGIGLDNVKKRLALLYPEKHELQIDSENNEYKVVLALDN